MDYPLGHSEIRAGIKRLCADFDSRYWQECDAEDAYPSAFVDALTAAGYLAALIPETYGGMGLPLSAGGSYFRRNSPLRGNAAACHAQMYTMGTVLRHGNEAQKQKYLPE